LKVLLMTPPTILYNVLSMLLGLFAFSLSAHGQTATAPSQSKATPVTMTECEGVNNCATWTFLGTKGNGQWPSGEVANLSVEKFDAGSVVIRRADSTGPSAGLTAIYTGTRHGERVGGEFTSSWRGHWQSKSGNWYATIGKAPSSLPLVMHFCGQHCKTLVWDDGQYVHHSSDAVEIWVVESFTPASVVIHRTDSNGFGGVYTGQMSPEGNRIINGTFNGRPDGYKLTWGTALNSVPGDDGPGRPAAVRPLICYGWFLGVICQ
jgi:hypothetical protein